MITISYTGSVDIDDSVYIDAAQEAELDWSNMTAQERVAFVKEVETDAGNEFLTEQTSKSVTITRIEFN